MATLAIAGLGAVIGSSFGFAALGWTIGATVGQMLFPGKLPDIKGPKLTDLRVQVSTYGVMIPILFGSDRIAGNVIWSTPLQPKRKKKTVGGKGGPSQTTLTWTYSASFAVGICKGPIAGVRRIWANGTLIYDLSTTATVDNIAASSQYANGLRIYTGSATQMPDPTIESYKGVGNVPGYRGLAYAVFTNFQLEKYGNSVANLNLTFEVVTEGTTSDLTTVGTWEGAGVSLRYDEGVFRYQTVPWTTGASLITRTLSSYSGNGTLIESKTVNIPALSAYPNLFVMPCANDERVLVQASHEAAYLYSDAGNIQLYPPDGMGTNSRAVAVGANPLPMPYRYGDYVYVCGSSDTVSWVARYSLSGGYPVAVWQASGSLNHRISVSDDGSVYVIAATPGDTLYRLSPELATLDSWESPFPSGYTGAPFLVIGQRLFGSEDDGATAVEEYSLATDPPSFVRSMGGGFGCLLAGPSLVAIIEPGTYNSSGDEGQTSKILALAPLLDQGTTTVGNVIAALCESVGIGAGERDTTGLTEVLTGYTLSQQMTARAAIEPLMQAFSVDAVVSGDVARFVLRGGAIASTIPDDHLAAYAEGSQRPPVLVMARAQETDLPRSVRVAYKNPAADYQIATQEAQRRQTSSQQTLTVELAVAMSDAQARAAATRILYNLWQARTTFQATLPRDYLALEPTDPITLAGRRMRITSAAMGANEVIQVEAEAEDTASIYTQAPAAAASPSPEQAIALPGPTAFQVLDLPALRDQDADGGVYLGVSGYLSGWYGAVIYRSSDNAETWDEIDTAVDGTVMGATTTALATGPTTLWDNLNTVTVQLLNGELESETELAVLNGANAAAIGRHGRWEVIQWQTATLVAPRTYTLSNLLRGRKGTEWATGLHAVGDIFVALSQSDILRTSLTENDYGVERSWRAASIGLDALSGDPVTLEAVPESLVPYAPAHFVANRVASNAGAHRYWRLYFTAGVSNSTTTSEVQLRETFGGADVTGSGTATADSTYGGSYLASNAFDDNTTTQWTSANTAYPHWLTYDFGSGNAKAITEYTIRAKTEHVDDRPTAWRFEYSDDNVEWTTVDTRSGQVFVPAETKTFTYGRVSFNWFRRARKYAEWRDNGDVPLDEPVERYRLRLLSVATGIPIAGSEWEVTGASTYTLNSDQLSTAYGTPDAPVRADIAQISASIGVGRITEAYA